MHLVMNMQMYIDIETYITYVYTILKGIGKKEKKRLEYLTVPCGVHGCANAT